MRGPAPPGESGLMRTRALGIFIAVWSASFALVHVAWAVGWRAGVPHDAPPIHDRPWFLAYDLAAGLLMFAAAGVAVRLTSGDPDPRRDARWRTASLVGAVAALARGLPAVGWDLATGRLSGVGFLADVWFTVAGLAGVALWWTTRPSQPTVAGVGRR